MLKQCTDFNVINRLGDSWNYVPPIFVPSSAKYILTQILVIAKLDGRKDFILTGFVFNNIHLYKKLPAQSYQLKHKNKMWKLFKIKNEATRTMTIASF